MTASEETRPEQEAGRVLVREILMSLDSARMTVFAADASARRLWRVADADESHETMTRVTANYQALLEADLNVVRALVRQWRLETLLGAGDAGLRIIEAEAAWVDDDENEEDATDD